MKLETVKPRIGVLGAPLDLGTARRGVDMGPSAVRYSGLEERLDELGIDVTDFGNLIVEMPDFSSNTGDDITAH